MAGHYELIGDRPTFFPPFVNERFGTPPYWACTFASLLNGVNVGFRGGRPATYAEVRSLSKASLDPDRRGGSTSQHMITAMATRYGQSMRLRHLPPDRVADRLGHGWAMVAGLTYGDLPKRHRIDKRFMGGHRVLLVGWDRGNTWIVDPLADEGAGYIGERIAWADLEPAWWSGEQLWFLDGMFLPQRRYRAPQVLPAAQPWSARRGTTLDLLSPARPGTVARRVKLGERLDAEFDAVVVELQPLPSNAEVGTRIRVSAGPYKGYYVDPKADGVKATIPDLAGLPEPPEKKVSATVDGGASVGGGAAGGGGGAAVDNAAFLAGRRFEWDRINKSLRPTGTLARP